MSRPHVAAQCVFKVPTVKLSAKYEDTCNSNVRVNMLYHLCVGIVALITVLTGTNFRAERTQTKGDTTCNRTLELQVSSYFAGKNRCGLFGIWRLSNKCLANRDAPFVCRIRSLQCACTTATVSCLSRLNRTGLRVAEALHLNMNAVWPIEFSASSRILAHFVVVCSNRVFHVGRQQSQKIAFESFVTHLCCCALGPLLLFTGVCTAYMNHLSCDEMQPANIACSFARTKAWKYFCGSGPVTQS